MKLNPNQLKRFHRLNEKLNTSPDYFLTNSTFLYLKYKYLLKPRFLIDVKLKLGVYSQIIIYNSLRISGYVRKKRKKDKFIGAEFEAIQKRYPFIFKRKFQKKRAKKERKRVDVATIVPLKVNQTHLDPVVIEIDSSSDDESRKKNSSAVTESGQNENAIPAANNKIQDEAEAYKEVTQNRPILEKNEDKERKGAPEKCFEPENDAIIEMANPSNQGQQRKGLDSNDEQHVEIQKEKENCTKSNEVHMDNETEREGEKNTQKEAEKTKEKQIMEESNNQSNSQVNEKKDNDNDDDNENDMSIVDELPSESLSPDEITRQLREQLKLLQMGKRNVSLFSRSSSTLDQSNKSISSLQRSPSTSSLDSFDENSREKENHDKQNEEQLTTKDQETSTPTKSLASVVQDNSKRTEESDDKCESSSLNETCRNEDDHNESSTASCNFLTSTPNVLMNLSNSADKSGGKFLDNLLSKLRSNVATTADANLSECSALSTSDNLLHKEIEKPILDSPAIDDDNASICSASSFTVFVGFGATNDDSSCERRPEMLSTPIVPNSSTNTHSAFLSEDLDAFMKENALDNPSNVVMPAKPVHDDALKCFDAEPPTLSFPELPDYLGRPRTVAEKRLILEKKNDLKYLMIENESTVYRELKKRSRTATAFNSNLIRDIQTNDIPFTRDCWRATTWLNTENGKFYFQTIPLGDQQIKIFSGRGNNKNKIFSNFTDDGSCQSIKHDGKCSDKCEPIDENIKINGIENFLPVEPDQSVVRSENLSNDLSPRKKLQLYSGDSLKTKAAPMCRKHLYLRRSPLDIELGPLQIFNMPLIQLEVNPKAKTPLPEIVRPYLKMALPYDNITPEWAEFAASAVQHKLPKRKRRQRARSAQTKKTFTFEIPYENYQHKVLVRKRKCPITKPVVNANLSDVDEIPFKFLKRVNKKDKVQKEVGSVLARMINSVAISLNEDCFTKEDPNGIYNVEDEKILETVTSKAQVKQEDDPTKTESRKRIM